MIMNDLESVIGFDEKWIREHKTIRMPSDGSHTDCDHWSDQIYKDKWKSIIRGWL